MSDNTSVTGERSVEIQNENQHGWAGRQAANVEKRVEVWRGREHKNDGGVGSSQIQSYEDYQKAVSGAQETNPAPIWKSCNLSEFVAKDIQDAFNQIKTMADAATAYAEFVSSYANLASKAVSTYSSLLEETINTIRNEIKDILDNMMGIGGVYVLHIPIQKGGIDQFKKTFYDSLTDTSDPSRPQFGGTTPAHALFMLAGATGYDAYLQLFKKFADFFSSVPVLDASPIPFPGITNFKVRAIRAPEFKWPLKQDALYALSQENKQDVYPDGSRDYLGFLRKVEGRLPASEKSQAFQGFCSWDVDDSTSPVASSSKLGLGMSIIYKNKSDIFGDRTPTYYTESFSRKNVKHWKRENDEAIEYTVTLHIPTDWLIFRSLDPERLRDMRWDNKAAIELVRNDGKEVALEKDGDHIYHGRLYQGFNFFSDTLIVDPTSVVESKKLLAQPTDLSQTIYYKMMTWGRSISLKVRFDRAENNRYEVRVSKTDAWKKDSGKPYLDSVDAIIEVASIQSFSAYDVFKNLSVKAEPIYEGGYDFNAGIDAPDYWAHSDFTPDEVCTNDDCHMPGYGPGPNWYSVHGLDLLPPLKKLVDKAKAYVDYTADSLIESLNGLAAYVQSVLDYIDAQARKIKELMELIKRMLIPPLAGVHMLSVSTKKGMPGLKALLEASFTGAPQIATGAYPTEYTTYGRKIVLQGNPPKTLDASDSQSGQTLNNNSDPSQAVAKFAAYAKDFKNSVSGKPKNLRRSKSEPDDETKRRMAIPIYDSNCYTTGIILVCESITAITSLVRLLNLAEFVNKEVDTLKRTFAGYREFEQLWMPNLVASYHGVLEKSASKNTDDNNDDKKVLDNIAAQQSDTGNKDGENRLSGMQNPDGGNAAILGSEPFCGPQYKLNIAGISITVELSACVSADELTKLINLKLREALIARGMSGDKAAAYSKIATVVDGNLIMQTPHSSVGDGTRKIKVVDGSASFGNASGNDVLKADTPFSLQEKPFPYKDGDLIIESFGEGTPTQDMVFKSQAIYEYGTFVSDPTLQNLGPNICRLQMSVDAEPRRIIDVTGNLGANPVDSTPTVVLPSETTDFTLPITLTKEHGRFLVEIDGSFLLLTDTPATEVKKYDQTITADMDFPTIGVRSGDTIYLQKVGETPFTSVVEKVENNKLYLRHILPYDTDVIIYKITRGGVPTQLTTGAHPLISQEINLVPDAPKTYTSLTQLAQDIQAAFIGAGISSQIFDISADNGSTGKIRIALREPWAYGPSVSLSIKKVSYASSSPSVLIPMDEITFTAPMDVDHINNKLRVRILGHTTSLAAYQTVSLPTPKTYSTLGDLISDINAYFISQDYPVSCTLSGAGVLFSVIDNGQAAHWSHSPNVKLEVKHLVNYNQFATYAVWSSTDGRRRPPVLKITGLTFPINVAEGYCQKLQLEMHPVISSRPSGWKEISLTPGVYTGVDTLALGFVKALNEAGFVSGDTGYLRVTTEGSDTLVLSLRPELEYSQPNCSLSIKNGRVSLPAYTGASVTTMSLRDYDYEKIKAWLLLNPTLNSPIGFPSPAPYIFVAQAGVYNGHLLIDSTNKSFQIRVTTPVTSVSVPSGWQTINVQEMDYSTITSFATAVQTAIEGVYGLGKITVTSVGDYQLQFSIVHNDLKGQFTTIELRQNGSAKFACFGSQTLGALIGTTVLGTGDKYFVEVLGLFALGSVASSSGRYDLAYQLGLLSDALPADSEGTRYRSAVGVSDYDLLSTLGISDSTEVGTLKVPYTLSTVVDQINASFSGYHTVASATEDGATLSLEGKIRSAAGKLEIVAFSDPDIAGSEESAAVAKMLFNYSAPRKTHVSVTGVGRDMLSSQYEAYLLDGIDQIVDIHNDFSFEIENLENDKVMETLADDNRQWIAEVISLDN